MKRFLLSIGLTLAAGFASAQCQIHLEGETTDISGTTLTLAAAPESDNWIEVLIKNTSGTEKLWKIRRVRITTPPATWTDWVCLAVEGEPLNGTCYPASATNPWTTPQPAQHLVDGDPAGGLQNGESAVASFHVNPQNVSGTAHYRYYVFQEGGPYEDSVDVIATSTLNVKEQKEDVTISVYPNPATNFITIAAPGMDDSFTVKMTDVLGKVVYNEEGTAPKKIDVSEFRNGVYIVAVMQRGVAVQTKRIVVKH